MWPDKAHLIAPVIHFNIISIDIDLLIGIIEDGC